ncbi:DUF3329 domain-containing protein [Methylocucumis oryzae]|uniref:DUF3329 domain-containing protein n=1 Tax=Methylocucumis oryzae TaxID=1632867 RepID=UPI003084431E
MNAWRGELVKLFLLYSGVSLISSVAGYLLPSLLVLTMILLAAQLLQIHRFEKWISVGGKRTYPKTAGVLGRYLLSLLPY